MHFSKWWDSFLAIIEDMCDLITWPWPHWLLSLPLHIRLSLCLISFVISEFISLHFFPLAYNWSLLTIPMGLSSWLFLKRGACCCYFSILFFEILSLQLHFAGLSWSPINLFSISCGICILFVEGSAFVSLHKLLTNAEIARLQAEEGELLSTQAYKQQLRLNQLKNRFIVNVNHEFRTPLTAAYSYLEMLQFLCAQDGDTDEMVTECLNNALSACSELTSLVNTVLDTLEIEHLPESFALEPVLLVPLLEYLLGQLDEIFPEKIHPVTLAIPLHASVLANRQYLYNTLHNLLVNAFTYTSPNTPIQISATTTSTSPSLLTLCVADSGPGIPPEEIPLLFQQFMRLERDLSGPTRGAGLGLYIAKLFVEAMDGRIWAESRGIPGEGTCFYLSLPASSSSASS